MFGEADHGVFHLITYRMVYTSLSTNPHQSKSLEKHSPEETIQIDTSNHTEPGALSDRSSSNVGLLITYH
jgi:hypothetical protein